MLLQIIILAVIGCFIGWITNLIAVRLLFKPIKPIKLPFGLKIQGVIPSRKSELAASIGNVVERQLVSSDDILNRLVSEKEINDLKSAIVDNVILILKSKLPAFLHGFTDKTLKKQLDNFMQKDGERYIRDMLEKTITGANERISVSKLVYEKIEALDLAAFEDIVTSVVKKELRYIEFLGAVLGFIIGILQGIILLFIK
ncbi:MAG: DUF445 family protein [Clostridiaceae bacterium]|nr:DUF445 family protein [Clostridiaceae bacterium]